MTKQTGTITQVVGVVVDVEFAGKDLPAIYDALEIARDKKDVLVLEVAQHLDERGGEVADDLAHGVRNPLLGGWRRIGRRPRQQRVLEGLGEQRPDDAKRRCEEQRRGLG